MAAQEKTPKSKSPPVERDADWLVSTVAPHLRIAHQVVGRVRVKLDTAAYDVAILRNGDGERMRQLFGALPGVRGISLNPLARSCVIEYDNAIIPDSAWPDLLAGRPTPAAETLLGLLAGVSPDSHVSSRKEKP